MTFWKSQNYRDTEQISDCQWQGVEKGLIIKGAKENFRGKGTVLY